VDIHGQHAWQSLTQPDAVRRLLDAYAQLHDGALRQAWTQWRSAQHALAQARTLQETALRERERLLWQIGEVQKLAPGPQEWDELQAQHTRLSHAHTLQDSATQVLALLEGEGMGARSALVRAQQLLTQQAHLEPRFDPWHKSWPPAWRRWKTPATPCTATCATPTSIPSTCKRWMSAWPPGWRRHGATNARQPNCPSYCSAGSKNCNGWTPQPTSARC